MRSRFPKVWCESCKTMQFAGSCPHGYVVDGRDLRSGHPRRSLKITDGDAERMPTPPFLRLVRVDLVAPPAPPQDGTPALRR